MPTIKHHPVISSLDQIERLNAMIDLHTDDDFSRQQYEWHRSPILKQLTEILATYRITPSELGA
ncbi:MAG: hypothetical protein AAF741_10285 [Bacteroidota bacterium]